MSSKKEILIQKSKKTVKKILGMDYKFKGSSFDEKNYSKSLNHLLSHRIDLLDERKSAGIRRDKKEFYPVIIILSKVSKIPLILSLFCSIIFIANLPE